jgi:hypothetical protein
VTHRGSAIANIRRMFPAALLLGIVAIACAEYQTTSVAAAPQQTQAIISEISTPSAPYPLHIALSPSGSELATWVTAGPGIALWLRPLDGQYGNMIQNSQSKRDDASGFPFWSPNGRTIAFFGDGKLKTVDLLGGPVRTLCDAPAGNGGTWNRDGVIVFAPNGNGPLYRVSATGGDATPVTELDPSRQEIAHRHPWFLPDGRHFLYVAISSSPENSGIWVGSIDSPERVFLVNTSFKAAFAAPDYLLFMDRTTLMARHFDPANLTLTGVGFAVAEYIDTNPRNSAAAFATSDTGTLAYRTVGVRREAGAPIAESPITVVANWAATPAATVLARGTPGVLFGPQAQVPAQAHKWARIQFPQLPALPDGSMPGGATVWNNLGSRGFVFSMSFGGRSAEADKMIVRLHRPDGTIVDPEHDSSRGLVSTNPGGTPYMYIFPWGRNVLEEAWIEMKVTGRTYWFELPYGFSRDPSAPLQPEEEKRGRPTIAPAMATMSPDDRIVPWLYVNYDLGTIQNGWSLSAEMANPFDANANVILYKGPENRQAWSLDSPKTSIDIVEPNGATLRSTCVNMHIHDDRLRRSDTFRFNRAGGRNDSRGWDTAEINVDDVKYTFTIPSSLSKYVHGTATPQNKAMLSRHYPYVDGLSVTNDVLR